MALPDPLMQRLLEALGRGQSPHNFLPVVPPDGGPDDEPLALLAAALGHHPRPNPPGPVGGGVGRVRTSSPAGHFGESFGNAAHHGENFDDMNHRGADAGAGFTRARGPMSGMAGAHHGESMGNAAHHGENFAGGGLGLALGDWAHLPAPPPPGPGIHWFGPGGAGIAYPTPNGGGPAGSHGEVYTPPIRRRPALAHALQVS